jgi:hypothetical protein
MSLSVSSLCLNAGTFRAAYPSWPHAEPEEAPMFVVAMRLDCGHVDAPFDGGPWDQRTTDSLRAKTGTETTCETCTADAQAMPADAPGRYSAIIAARHRTITSVDAAPVCMADTSAVYAPHVPAEG